MPFCFWRHRLAPPPPPTPLRGGRFAQECPAAFSENGWPVSPRMPGRFAPESAGGGYEVLEVPRPRSRGDVEIAGFLSEFQALLDFRLVIETATAARAAQYRTDTDLLRLARAQAALEASRGLATFRQADSAFHLAIATASRNSFLSQAVFDARAAMFLSMDAADPNIILETTVKGHAQILHAVQKGDPAMARSAMTHHIEVTRNEIRKGVLALDKASPSPSPLAASGWPRQPLHEEHADD